MEQTYDITGPIMSGFCILVSGVSSEVYEVDIS